MAEAIESSGSGERLSMNNRGVQIMPRPSRRGRQTQSSDFLNSLRTIIEPDDYDRNWSVLEFHRDAFDRYTPRQLLDVLINLSPHMSRGVWNYLRLCNPDVQIDAYRVGTKETDDRAKQALTAFRERLAETHGTDKNVYNELFMGAISGGAFFAELIFDASGTIPIDIVVPDPWSVRFRKETDPVRGEYWQPGQWQKGTFTPFDSERVTYIPVDNRPGRPYGRPPLIPAIFPSIFLMGLYHDMRRVVAQQGYPRYDIEIDLEKLMTAYKNEATQGGLPWERVVDRTVQKTEDAFGRLEPDETFVHTSDTKLNTPKGMMDSQALSQASTLIESLERSAVQGLKTMPMLLGITDGVNDANANRQWEMETESIDSLQDNAEALLERFFTIALEAQGIAADVSVEFDKIRQSEELRIEQAAEKRINNAVVMELQGYKTWEESARYAIGEAPSDQAIEEYEAAKQRADDLAAQNPDTPGEPDPGADGDTGDTADDEATGDARMIDKAVALASIDTRGARHRRR